MKPRPWQKFVATGLLIGLSLIFATPFFWMLSTSLKADEMVQTNTMNFVPSASFVDVNGKSIHVKPLSIKEGVDGKPDQAEVQIYDGDKLSDKTMLVDRSAVKERFFLNTANYVLAWTSRPFPHYLRNTLIVCALSVIGTILSCSLVAYGLSMVERRGRELLFWIMLATMMLPGQVTMIPLFLTFKKLGWINTILPLVVPTFLGNAFFIFLLRQFYRSVPRDLVEAARIDGCSELGIWARIMLPLSKPALAVVGLFTFMGAWNAFLEPLIYLHDEEKYTLSIGLAMFQGQYSGEWGQMMAMSLLMTLPVILLFFFTQKQFIQGVKLSGIKG